MSSSPTTVNKKRQFKNIRLQAMLESTKLPVFGLSGKFPVFGKDVQFKSTVLQAIEQERPVLAPNVQLMGELKESGFQQRQWLIQREGQFIQVSELLYRVAEQINGERTLREIAAKVTETTDWIVKSAHIRQIIHNKLIPMGVVRAADGSVAVPPGAGGTDWKRSPLALTARAKFIGPRVLDPITKVLQVFFTPFVLVPVLIAVVLAHVWLYVVHGLTTSLRDILYTPGGLLLALAVMVISNIFHEFGHASAIRYGGGRARGIGAGIYLVYPVFYTDLTDSYRLGRWARVRTDLGGFYFHFIFELGIIAYTLISRNDFLLIIVALIDLDIIYQCMPFVRFDGYWTLADLTGIPDFYSQMVPFVLSVLRLPALKGTKLPELKPWVKVIFACYSVSSVFVIGYLLTGMVIYEPTLVMTTLGALVAQRTAFAAAHMTHDVAGMVLPGVQVVLLILPLLGNALILTRVGQRVGETILKLSKHFLPQWSRVGALCAAGIVALVLFLQVPQLPFLDGFGVPSTKPVDGITCDHLEHSTEHVHIHLAIYMKNQPVTIPGDIGRPSTCFYWLHTHRTDGVIHLEAPATAAYTLGQFLDIWAQSKQTLVLTSTSLLGNPLNGHELVAWVSQNGQPAQRYSGNVGDLVLQGHQIITLAYDSPNVNPVTYFDWRNSSAGG
ncbi:MAG: hypothetical protein JO125_04675 [Chloroflexi bacterium]|nr:hypothetical protein [Ktedonobacteraceae bacterium]MBV9021686.1 hypothetical protein [Ktedonobacteraceae bacterium]MBV9706682.1 hypothetical protein [Chloroflexota bacterium]